MSDYGDDYSDYGEEWLYVEEEYIVADDLAEHAVPSPPPTVYDEDVLLDWDRFDYFNDLEYASDGYDNASFEPKNGTGAAKIGQKRKRGASAARGRKKQRLETPRALGQGNSTMLCNSPVVWRSQANRGPKPNLLAEDAEPFALLKDWRQRLADAPEWAQQSSRPASPGPLSGKGGKAHAAFVSEPMSPASEADVDDEEDEGAGIDATALMSVLQDKLAAAGGPLAGMDPQQLLEFAMRMATNKDAGDDIAGEMADEMLAQGDEEEEDEKAEEKLLSWVAQHRNASNLPNGDSSTIAPTPKSPDASCDSKRPPTPPSSEANRSLPVTDDAMRDVESSTANASASTKNNTLEVKQVSRKRKATDPADVENSTITTKKRATTSYNAPTASSQARTTAPRTTKSGRVKR